MQKISYLLKNSFKKTIQFFFKLIYGAINSDQNQISKKNIFIKEVSIVKKKNNTNYKVCRIANGRAYTDFVENLAVIENQTALKNFSYQTIDGEFRHVSENSCIKKGTPRIKKKINGSVLCLTQGVSGHSNYFHWLFDILPKIIYHLEEPLPDPAAITSYLICQEASKDLKVLLSGVGADEIFGGYPRYLANKVSKQYNIIPKFLRRSIIEPMLNSIPSSRNSKARNIKKQQPAYFVVN